MSEDERRVEESPNVRPGWVELATSEPYGAEWERHWRQIRTKWSSQSIFGHDYDYNYAYGYYNYQPWNYYYPASYINSVRSYIGTPRSSATDSKGDDDDDSSTEDGRHTRKAGTMCVIGVGLLIIAAAVIPLLYTILRPKAGPEREMLGRVSMELILVKINFTEGMNNKSSPDYRELSSVFTSEIDRLYQSSELKDHYISSHITDLRNGSVIVSYDLLMRPLHNKFATDADIENVLYSVERDEKDKTLGKLDKYRFRISSLKLLDGNMVIKELDSKTKFKQVEAFSTTTVPTRKVITISTKPTATPVTNASSSVSTTTLPTKAPVTNTTSFSMSTESVSKRQMTSQAPFTTQMHHSKHSTSTVSESSSASTSSPQISQTPDIRISTKPVTFTEQTAPTAKEAPIYTTTVDTRATERSFVESTVNETNRHSARPSLYTSTTIPPHKESTSLQHDGKTDKSPSVTSPTEFTSYSKITIGQTLTIPRYITTKSTQDKNATSSLTTEPLTTGTDATTSDKTSAKYFPAKPTTDPLTTDTRFLDTTTYIDLKTLTTEHKQTMTTKSERIGKEGSTKVGKMVTDRPTAAVLETTEKESLTTDKSDPETTLSKVLTTDKYVMDTTQDGVTTGRYIAETTKTLPSATGIPILTTTTKDQLTTGEYVKLTTETIHPSTDKHFLVSTATELVTSEEVQHETTKTERTTDTYGITTDVHMTETSTVISPTSDKYLPLSTTTETLEAVTTDQLLPRISTTVPEVTDAVTKHSSETHSFEPSGTESITTATYIADKTTDRQTMHEYSTEVMSGPSTTETGLKESTATLTHIHSKELTTAESLQLGITTAMPETKGTTEVEPLTTEERTTRLPPTTISETIDTTTIKTLGTSTSFIQDTTTVQSTVDEKSTKQLTDSMSLYTTESPTYGITSLQPISSASATDEHIGGLTTETLTADKPTTDPRSLKHIMTSEMEGTTIPVIGTGKTTELLPFYSTILKELSTILPYDRTVSDKLSSQIPLTTTSYTSTKDIISTEISDADNIIDLSTTHDKDASIDVPTTETMPRIEYQSTTPLKITTGDISAPSVKPVEVSSTVPADTFENTTVDSQSASVMHMDATAAISTDISQHSSTAVLDFKPETSSPYPKAMKTTSFETPSSEYGISSTTSFHPFDSTTQISYEEFSSTLSQTDRTTHAWTSDSPLAFPDSTSTSEIKLNQTSEKLESVIYDITTEVQPSLSPEKQFFDTTTFIDLSSMQSSHVIPKTDVTTPDRITTSVYDTSSSKPDDTTEYIHRDEHITEQLVSIDPTTDDTTITHPLSLEIQQDQTTSPIKYGTKSSTLAEGITSSKIEETPRSPIEERTTSSKVEVTKLSPIEEGTTSSPTEEGLTFPPVEERITSSPIEEGTSHSPLEKWTISSPIEEGLTYLPTEERTTSSPIEEGLTFSPIEEGATPSSIMERTSPSQIEGTSRSPRKERTSSSMQEGTRPSPIEEGTTYSLVEEGLTFSPIEEETTTSLIVERKTSSRIEEMPTVLSIEEKTTSQIEEVATRSTIEEGLTSSPIKDTTTEMFVLASDTTEGPASVDINQTDMLTTESTPNVSTMSFEVTGESMTPGADFETSATSLTESTSTEFSILSNVSDESEISTITVQTPETIELDLGTVSSNLTLNEQNETTTNDSILLDDLFPIEATTLSEVPSTTTGPILGPRIKIFTPSVSEVGKSTVVVCEGTNITGWTNLVLNPQPETGLDNAWIVDNKGEVTPPNAFVRQYNKENVTVAVDTKEITCTTDVTYTCTAEEEGQVVVTDTFNLKGRVQPEAKLTVPVEMIQNRWVLGIRCTALLTYPENPTERVIWRKKPKGATEFEEFQSKFQMRNYTRQRECKKTMTFRFDDNFMPNEDWNDTVIQCAVTGQDELTGESYMAVSNTEVIRFIPEDFCMEREGIFYAHPYGGCSYVSCPGLYVIPCGKGKCFNPKTETCETPLRKLATTTQATKKLAKTVPMKATSRTTKSTSTLAMKTVTSKPGPGLKTIATTPGKIELHGRSVAFEKPTYTLHIGKVQKLRCKFDIKDWTQLEVSRILSGASKDTIGTVDPSGQTSTKIPHITMTFSKTTGTIFIIFGPVNCDDAGQYFCNVHTDGAVQTAETTADVIGIPTASVSLPAEIVENRWVLRITCKANLGYPAGEVIWRVKREGEGEFEPFVSQFSMTTRKKTEGCLTKTTLMFDDNFLPNSDWNNTDIQCIVQHSDAITNAEGFIASNTEKIQFVPMDICDGKPRGPVTHPFDKCSKYINCPNLYVLACRKGYCFDQKGRRCVRAP